MSDRREVGLVEEAANLILAAAGLSEKPMQVVTSFSVRKLRESARVATGKA
ncbi:hypothetical protein NOU13_31780 [Rhodococcus erythropolis]|uniref:hypothetical protein n=1 Tax=Rhodococcus erythropolis TaxID=1833 RepID=UPI002109AD24|nr:hypothetical protein [Rhodococcus erythropolis]MCQ4129088.1 hypothetical protein [Rhodococcus erythropolis]